MGNELEDRRGEKPRGGRQGKTENLFRPFLWEMLCDQRPPPPYTHLPAPPFFFAFSGFTPDSLSAVGIFLPGHLAQAQVPPDTLSRGPLAVGND